MVELEDQSKALPSSKLIGRCAVSCIVALLTHFPLSLVPRFFSSSSFLLQLVLSALLLLLVLGFCRWSRRLLGLYASAPAFVFFNLLFIWSFYIFVVRKAVSSLMDALFNGEVVMIVIGLCSIHSKDPGFVMRQTTDSDKLVQSSSSGVDTHNESSHSLKRIRYCRSCKAYIKGFDHHCPAFGNCIGQNNYVFFMVLLVGFLTTEASYLVCSIQYTRKNFERCLRLKAFVICLSIIEAFGMEINEPKLVVRRSWNFGRNWKEIDLMRNLAISTMLFSILQVLWQGVFLMWHVYCVSFNVRTDEWINWKKYPEFQVVYSEPGEDFTRVVFRNPYDKGILQNVKDFLALGV